MNLHSNKLKAEKMHAGDGIGEVRFVYASGKPPEWRTYKSRKCVEFWFVYSNISVLVMEEKVFCIRTRVGVRNKRQRVHMNIFSKSFLARSAQHKCFKTCTAWRQIPDSQNLFVCVCVFLHRYLYSLCAFVSVFIKTK